MAIYFGNNDLHPEMGTQALSRLRRLAPGKALYGMYGNEPGNQQQLTVETIYPTPRAGNPGTCKTKLNMRMDEEIVVDGETRKVPLIIKVETSFPVGTDEGIHATILSRMASLLAPQGDDSTVEREDLFYLGILPGDAS